MDIIWKLFIAYYGETTIRIPHELTLATLEVLDSSIAISRLRKEENAAFNTSDKRMREATIEMR